MQHGPGGSFVETSKLIFAKPVKVTHNLVVPQEPEGILHRMFLAAVSSKREYLQRSLDFSVPLRAEKRQKSKVTILTFEGISGQEIFDIYFSEGELGPKIPSEV